MSIKGYRLSDAEKARTADLVNLTPISGESALDVGARDGHFSLLFAERFMKVYALDLELPMIQHAKVVCVKGNAARLDFPDNTFDFVFCAEVLEHIPQSILRQVCDELCRVSKRDLLIGVPFHQDNRVGRTTCNNCGKKNPPWGHVNVFDEYSLRNLFPAMKVCKTSMVGEAYEATNKLSAWLMDLAGNPYGTYGQEEPCIHCGEALTTPPPRTLSQKVLTKAAFAVRRSTERADRVHANWIHLLLTKQ